MSVAQSAFSRVVYTGRRCREAAKARDDSVDLSSARWMYRRVEKLTKRPVHDMGAAQSALSSTTRPERDMSAAQSALNREVYTGRRCSEAAKDRDASIVPGENHCVLIVRLSLLTSHALLRNWVDAVMFEPL